MLRFYDPNMMNITIQQKIYCPYPYSIREFFPRKKNYLYLYPQYSSVSDPFSSLFAACMPKSCYGCRRALSSSCLAAHPSRRQQHLCRHERECATTAAADVAGRRAWPTSRCRCRRRFFPSASAPVTCANA
jgi:hypothetical protein